MSEFEDIRKEIEKGREGRNSSIPMGFDRLNKYIGIRKRIMTLVFGSTGSGKTGLTHDAWILNPFEWWMRHKNTSPLKVKPILFSFERSKIYTKTKWLSRKIFMDQGKSIPIGKILGWWENNLLTHDEHDMVMMYEDYINELCEYVTIIEGATNPTGCYKYIKNYAETHGRIEQIDEHHKVYIPDNEYEIVIPIVDHIGLTKLEREYNNRKEAIDKLTEYGQIWRDLYGYSPVFVAQINRDLGSAAWGKMAELEPSIDQIKESSNPAEAADCIISLFDPLRYRTTDSDYDASKFINMQTGAKHFRSIKILKNTYGEDSIKIGCAFQGSTGRFRELPHKKYMYEEIYEHIIQGHYFLSDYKR